jgi:hypothetical protein
MNVKDVRTYGSEYFDQSNVFYTIEFIRCALSEAKRDMNDVSLDALRFIDRRGNVILDYKISNGDRKVHEDARVTIFPLSFDELLMGKHMHRDEFIWMKRQMDGFSCPGSAIFTCTSGYADVSPSIVRECIYITNTFPRWVSCDHESSQLLTVEGMYNLVYDVMKILPVMIYAKVTDDSTVTREDEVYNVFDDEYRFTKLMRVFRYASVCTNDDNHWVSIVCVPVKEESFFIVCDSMDHDGVTMYKSFDSFRSNFLVRKTRSTCHMEYNESLPLTLCLYPLMSRDDDDGPYFEISRELISRTLMNICRKIEWSVDCEYLKNIIDATHYEWT